MDRTYVNQNHKTPVYILGLELWRDHVIRQPNIRERLRNILLELVERERKGELINQSLFKQITKVAYLSTCFHSVRSIISLPRHTPQMLIDLGSTVYAEDFEAHFISASSEFYKVCDFSPISLILSNQPPFGSGVCMPAERGPAVLDHLWLPGVLDQGREEVE